MFDKPFYLNTWESEVRYDDDDYEKNLTTVRISGYSFARTKVAVKLKMPIDATMFQTAQFRVRLFKKIDAELRNLYWKSIKKVLKLKRLKNGIQPLRSARCVNRRGRVLHESRQQGYVPQFISDNPQNNVRFVRINRRRR